MRLINTILLLIICSISCNLNATVLSAASRFIKLYDNGFTNSFHKGADSHQTFLKAFDSPGFSGMEPAIRMMIAVLSSETEHDSKDPKDLYLEQLKASPKVSLHPHPNCFSFTMSLDPISGPGGVLDVTFQNMQKNKYLEERLKLILIRKLKIIDESSEFMKLFSDLDIMEDYQELKSEIEGLSQSE
ncbi:MULTISPECIES: hypothetical protein [unclassified Endozoicomonas]|uniref:hypothetical protein n=1 Tax=unclassified Endozoicomonas TaxID=2644528 RepID=UPI003BB52DFA